MPKLKHPEGGTIEVAPDQVANYESQGWEPLKKSSKDDD